MRTYVISDANWGTSMRNGIRFPMKGIQYGTIGGSAVFVLWIVIIHRTQVITYVSNGTQTVSATRRSLPSLWTADKGELNTSANILVGGPETKSKMKGVWGAMCVAVYCTFIDPPVPQSIR